MQRAGDQGDRRVANLDAPHLTPADAKREDDLLQRVLAKDPATVSQSEQALVDMGSAAYAASLRQQLRKGRGSQKRRMAEVGQLAAIERQNHLLMPILTNLLGADDPQTRAADAFQTCRTRTRRSAAGRQRGSHHARLVIRREQGCQRREIGHAMWKFLPLTAIVKEMQDKLIQLARFDPDEAVREVAGYSLRRVQQGY